MRTMTSRRTGARSSSGATPMVHRSWSAISDCTHRPRSARGAKRGRGGSAGDVLGGRVGRGWRALRGGRIAGRGIDVVVSTWRDGARQGFPLHGHGARRRAPHPTGEIDGTGALMLLALANWIASDIRT